jgi:hypothetical protein
MSMESLNVLNGGLIPWETEPAAEAMADLPKFRVAGMAVQAVVLARQVLEVGSGDDMSRATLRADQTRRGLEIGDRPDVCAWEMMDQPLRGKPGRAALAAALAKRRKTLTPRAELNPVENRLL